MPHHPTPDEAAARAVVENVYQAWTANDPDAFVADYAEDAIATLPGTYLVGRDAVRETMAGMFAGPFRGCRSLLELSDIRLLGDTAIVTSRGTVVLAGQTDPQPWVLETWVLSRGPGSWQVRAYHNCPA
jgi:uncharacterized protein (TIGR02246 family)